MRNTSTLQDAKRSIDIRVSYHTQAHKFYIIGAKITHSTPCLAKEFAIPLADQPTCQKVLYILKKFE